MSATSLPLLVRSNKPLKPSPPHTKALEQPGLVCQMLRGVEPLAHRDGPVPAQQPALERAVEGIPLGPQQLDGVVVPPRHGQLGGQVEPGQQRRVVLGSLGCPAAGGGRRPQAAEDVGRGEAHADGLGVAQAAAVAVQRVQAVPERPVAPHLGRRDDMRP
ncbi:uncharacterized protein B0I36DRAFT_331588 [Microdochium trichocladiopsis]|uniref:Uncharacterized protein n=1 Tax=Microdochium trichocladiopsis TaxID=1682393 RepID=A0A9P8Y0D3_9PEZI|nr:uncharacterized protein B0I36DRAFT_331588 [Microdochium trichocladiopsis]KAH7024531.1 hypothetical protein B0I36DRAFT_331588 [Microdochium trichocladiopsis]